MKGVKVIAACLLLGIACSSLYAAKLYHDSSKEWRDMIQREASFHASLDTWMATQWAIRDVLEDIEMNGLDEITDARVQQLEEWTQITYVVTDLLDGDELKEGYDEVNAATTAYLQAILIAVERQEAFDIDVYANAYQDAWTKWLHEIEAAHKKGTTGMAPAVPFLFYYSL